MSSVVSPRTEFHETNLFIVREIFDVHFARRLVLNKFHTHKIYGINILNKWLTMAGGSQNTCKISEFGVKLIKCQNKYISFRIHYLACIFQCGFRHQRYLEWKLISVYQKHLTLMMQSQSYLIIAIPIVKEDNIRQPNMFRWNVEHFNAPVFIWVPF